MDKQKLYDTIEARSEDFIRISDEIWGYAELSLNEYKSAACYVDFLKREGFQVREQIAGIPTAFSGSFGEGKPVIGILGEFDALSSLSQKPALTFKEPEIPGGNGHGCGHNLLGVGSLSAAVAVKRMIEAGELQGTVVFYGCPGEEGCAGKTFMARDGEFRDLDAALCWHPGDTNEVTTGACAASLQLTYTFTGVAAHAAGDPWNGRSALDAAELMNVGVQFLREHIRSCESLHYSILDAGGASPNVVQPTAQLLYMVRSDNVTNAKKLLARVNRIAEGACLMTDTTVEIRQVDGTSSTLSNTVLEQAIHRNLLEAPMPTHTAEEEAFAAALYETYPSDELPGTAPKYSARVRRFVREMTDNGQKPLNDFIMPYVPSDAFSPGSTDVGDVSWLTPTAQCTTVTWTSNSPGHSWQNVSLGKTTIGYKGMLYAGKVLAGTAADLMEDPQLLAQARAEFAEMAADGYDCPLEPDLKAKPVSL